MSTRPPKVPNPRIIVVSHEEIWVPSWRGAYLVSNHGRVKRLARANGATAGHVLRPVIRSQYPSVTLSVKGKTWSVAVHILVAMAFVGRRPKDHDVNHIDGNKTNNRDSNLEYVTRTGNMRHAAKLGRLVHKATIQDVIGIRAAAATGECTHKEIAEKFGLSRPQTTKIIAGLSWRHVA